MHPAHTVHSPTPEPPRLLRVEEAAQRLGIGRSTTFVLIRNGQLRSVKIGSRRLIPSDAIPEMIARLSEQGRYPEAS